MIVFPVAKTEKSVVVITVRVSETPLNRQSELDVRCWDKTATVTFDTTFHVKVAALVVVETVCTCNCAAKTDE